MPEIVSSFDGSWVKLVAGTQTRFNDGDVFFSAGLGARFFASPWLNASVFLPYRWNVGEDAQTGRDVDLHGIGDLSLGVAFDLLELALPSMQRVACPETGGPILARLDDDGVIKSPHLTFSVQLSIPTGSADHKERWWFYPAQYQPGAGVFGTTASVFYAQGFGPVIPGLGVAYAYAGGENPAGYVRPDALVYSVGLGWLFWEDRLGSLQATANITQPLSEGTLDGKVLAGSDMVMARLDIGASVWVGSFWKKTRKITLGLNVGVPLVEGETRTEPRYGFSGTLSCAFGL